MKLIELEAYYRFAHLIIEHELLHLIVGTSYVEGVVLKKLRKVEITYSVMSTFLRPGRLFSDRTNICYI